MHFHHRHDVAGCTDDHTDDWPDWAVAILATLDRMEIQIMTAVQADLDAATTVIGELVAKVSDLEAQIAASTPALDAAALNAEVATAQALLTPAPAPAPAAPVADPSTPAADPAQPPADQPVPSVPLA